MPYFKATIQVLVECADQSEACDAIGEAIRPMLQEFSKEPSAWVDWRYCHPHPIPEEISLKHAAQDFEYAQAEYARQLSKGAAS